MSKSKEIIKRIIVLIYARVSSTRQKIEGHGLESQVHRCIAFAQQNGWEVSEELIFKDDFTGGGDFMKRPAMSALLQHIDENPHQEFVIIVDDLSRLARDITQHVRLRVEFEKRGVRVCSPNFNFEDTPEGELVERIVALQNEYHRKSNRRQVIQKQKAILEMGGYPFGGLKLGYETSRDPVTRRNVKVPNDLAPVVIEGLEGFAYKRFHNRMALAVFWKEKGVFKKQSAEQCLGTVNRMLRDSFYAGFVEYETWEVSRRLGWHKALISEETFNLIQKRLDAETSGTRIRHEHNPDFELCGLVRCAECGSLLRSYWATGRTKKYPYYECKEKGCLLRNKSINREDVEGDFKKIIKDYKPKPGLTEVAAAMFDDVWKIKYEDIGKSTNRVQKQIEILNQEIEQFSLKHAKAPVGSVLETELTKLIEVKAVERNRLEEDLAKRGDTKVSYRTAAEKVFGAVKSPLKLWTSASIHQKKQLFFFFFDERLVYERKKSYRTAQISPILRLFERNDNSNSLDVEMVEIESTSENVRQHASTVSSLPFDLNAHR